MYYLVDFKKGVVDMVIKKAFGRIATFTLGLVLVFGGVVSKVGNTREILSECVDTCADIGTDD